MSGPSELYGQPSTANTTEYLAARGKTAAGRLLTSATYADMSFLNNFLQFWTIGNAFQYIFVFHCVN